MRRRVLALLSAFAICLATGLAAITSSKSIDQADPIVGRWDLTVAGTDAPYSSWLEVKREGEKYTGRFVGRFGSARPVAQITFSDGALLFNLPPQYEQTKVNLDFKGKLIGAKLSGMTNGENGKQLRWAGVRAPALPPKAAPVWGKPIQLFNGKTLAGWRLRSNKAPGCWSVDDGAMTNSNGCVDILTERTFTDFKLSLDFKLVDQSNSGVYLRGRYELQVLDDFGKPAESHGMGGLYGFLSPKTNAAKKAGEWQHYEITLLGRQLSAALNGQPLLENEEIPGVTGGAINSNESAPGPIMLQGDHGKVWYKNITLTPAR